MWSELTWFMWSYFILKWSEVKWSGVTVILGDKSALYIRVTYTEDTWLYCDYLIWVYLVLCVFLLVCTIFLYCFVYVYLFSFVLYVVVYGLLPSSNNSTAVSSSSSSSSSSNSGGRSSIRNLRTRHAVVTGAHTSRIPMKLVRLTKMCPNETYSRVQAERNLSGMFPLLRMVWNKEMLYSHSFSTLLESTPFGRLR